MNFNSHFMNLLLLLLVYFSTLLIHIKCDPPYPALTFYQNIHAIISIPGKIRIGDNMIKKDSIVVACPAESPEEDTFNFKSFSKNSLFVKNVYKAPVDLTQVPYEICQHAYKMSISYHKSIGEFVFGYEIYYEKRKFTGFESINHDNFDFISNAYSSLLSRNKILKPKLQLAEDKPLDFTWISSFKLKFDNKRTRPKHVTYAVSNARETGITCKDYDLGKEVYEKKKINLNSLYENQNKIFENVVLPEFLHEDQKPDCESEKKCLTKWSLIPPEEFRFRLPEPKEISCSDLATVPIWKSTAARALHKLDRFLYALAKIIRNDLQVTAGVHGKLNMRIHNTGPQKTKAIKLGEKGEISVPYVIYKLVKYDVLVTDYEDLVIPAIKVIVIVIQNDPYFDTKNAPCNKENCEKWGWQGILYKDVPSKGSASNYVFCCPKTKETMKNLGLKFDGIEDEVLNLTYIPVYDESQMKTTYPNIVATVVEKMNHLFGDRNDSIDDHDGEEILDSENDNFYSAENDKDEAETTNQLDESILHSTTSNSSESVEEKKIDEAQQKE